MQDKFTKLEKNWILYDVGNSAFTLMVTTILPIFFNSLAKNSGLSSQAYLSYWGYAMTISTIVVAILGPILGAIADHKDMKKKLFMASLVIGIAATFSFSFWKSWSGFLIAFVIAKIGYNISLIFYDAMLTDVTSPDRMDRLSTNGFAWGYIGSVIPFVISLVFILILPKMGLSMGLAMFLAFITNGLWWLICSLPLLKTYKQKYYVSKRSLSLMDPFKQLMKTIKDLKNHPAILFFLLAFFFYIDGVYTIINMATAYGQSLGLDSTGLLLALLVTQIVAFPASLLFSKVSKNVRADKLVALCIIGYTFITIFAVQLDKLWEFWVLAIAVGLFQGGIQALSRSYYAKIIPPEKSGEYFGLYDIFGKGASSTGTLLISIITQLTGKQNIAIFSLVILFVIGFFLFIKSTKILYKNS